MNKRAWFVAASMAACPHSPAVAAPSQDIDAGIVDGEQALRDISKGAPQE